MAEISFKGVGEKSTDDKFQRKVNEIPIGIKTPLRLGAANDGILSMHFSLRDQVRDNLRNLLLTNHGERLAMYDFGANLRAVLFDLSSDTFETDVMVNVKRAVGKWMPYVTLDTFEKTIDRGQNQNVAKVNIKISYSVPSLGVVKDAVDVSFFVGG